MTNYIALFRGINVGGRNILPMDDLKVLLEDLGCEKVQTYIQSGNVIFRNKEIDTARLAEDISSKIQKIHEFKPKVLLLKKADLENAINNNPFDTGEGKALHFFFLESKPENPDIDKLNLLKSDSEQFILKENVFYLYSPDGIGRSKLAAKVERCIGIPVTARNWNTVKKLSSMII